MGVAPTREIAPNVHMPLVGLGTWLYNSSRAEAAVAAALALGYTHVDGAYGYKNSDGVGRALNAHLARTGRPRSDLFLTSKIPGGLSAAEATQTLEANLAQFQVEYVDLMLVHYPATWAGEGGKAMRQAEWKALEQFQRSGKARAIGVSHYCARHLQDILEVATITPALNQVEFHVGMGSAGPNATDDRSVWEAAGITYMGFSPLCGPCGTSELVDGALVTKIGAAHGKTGAQVSLRWQTQQNIPVIPKSSNPEHLRQNLDLFDWELTPEEMLLLSTATSPPACGGPNATSGDCSVS